MQQKQRMGYLEMDGSGVSPLVWSDDLNIKGSGPEWDISSMLHSRDIPI